MASSWSTVVWDAFKIGKTVFLFTPFERPDWINTFWNDLVPNIKTVSETESLVAPEISNNPKEKIHCEIVEWLGEVITSHEPLSVKRCSRISRVKKLAYLFRSMAFEFSMRFLKGGLVPQGLRRDYFDY